MLISIELAKAEHAPFDRMLSSSVSLIFRCFPVENFLQLRSLFGATIDRDYWCLKTISFLNTDWSPALLQFKILAFKWGPWYWRAGSSQIHPSSQDAHFGNDECQHLTIIYEDVESIPRTSITDPWSHFGNRHTGIEAELGCCTFTRVDRQLQTTSTGHTFGQEDCRRYGNIHSIWSAKSEAVYTYS